MRNYWSKTARGRLITLSCSGGRKNWQSFQSIPPTLSSPWCFDLHEVGKGLLSLWAACPQVCPPRHGPVTCEPGHLKDIPAGDRIIYGEPGQCKFIVSNGQWKGGKKAPIGTKAKGCQLSALTDIHCANKNLGGQGKANTSSGKQIYRSGGTGQCRGKWFDQKVDEILMIIMPSKRQNNLFICCKVSVMHFDLHPGVSLIVYINN